MLPRVVCISSLGLIGALRGGASVLNQFRDGDAGYGEIGRPCCGFLVWNTRENTRFNKMIKGRECDYSTFR